MVIDAGKQTLEPCWVLFRVHEWVKGPSWHADTATPLACVSPRCPRKVVVKKENERLCDVIAAYAECVTADMVVCGSHNLCTSGKCSDYGEPPPWLTGGASLTAMLVMGKQ
jgi:hypothetical protein